jgi:hypothetical protein
MFAQDWGLPSPLIAQQPVPRTIPSPIQPSSQKLAEQHSMAVLVTNQVMDDFASPSGLPATSSASTSAPPGQRLQVGAAGGREMLYSSSSVTAKGVLSAEKMYADVP